MTAEGGFGAVRWSFGDATDGDLAVDADPELLARRRQAMSPLPASAWTALRQVHGTDVVVVRRPGEHSGDEADGAVTSAVGAVLSVTTADCAPVLFHSSAGTDTDTDSPAARSDVARPTVVGAAHAGWRGLSDGVLEATVEAMRELGAGPITALLGPCISPAAYEFGAAELTTLALQFGPDVVGVTVEGRPAFDLRAGVRAALRAQGVALGSDALDGAAGPSCTALGGGHFSWRAQQTSSRQASIIWIEP